MVVMLVTSPLMAVLIVLVVLSMLMVFVVFIVGRKGCWRPITWRNTKYWPPVVHHCVIWVPISAAG
jgi:hypothetical protein